MESLHIAMGIAAKQGLDLVTNLLSWAQTQSNKIQAYPDQFQLDHAIEEVMAYYSTSALKKQIEMTITRTGDNLSVFADPDMIKIVIQNLISNAIKFTSSGGRIDIIIEDLGKEKLVKIRDNGIGMPPALVKKLNNNLKLGSRNGTELEKGTGLGIMICKDLIKRNKGRLILSSKEDEGTVASLFL